MRSAPVAIWRAGSAQPLRRWLNSQQPDPRQQLTITAHYREGGEPATLSAVQVLLRQAGARGTGARVLIEPGADDLQATLAYDKALGSALPRD